MKNTFSAILLATILMSAVSAKAEMITCTECGMISDAGSRFTSKIVQGDKTFRFCDIGDLLVYLNKKKLQNPNIQVKDYPSGAWLNAQQALYVRAARKFNSPMGWGIAAFKEKTAAAESGNVMDYQEAVKSVR